MSGQTALLEGKVAIVTGASRGIGALTARAFAAAGAAVALAARDEQALASVAEEIVGAGGRALIVATDVSDRPRSSGSSRERPTRTAVSTSPSITPPAAVIHRRTWPMSRSRTSTAPSPSPSAASSWR
jgi:NAD(P)-dependent dehydrogenase (short-subunit alcohol dehydrogenase family)